MWNSNAIFKVALLHVTICITALSMPTNSVAASEYCNFPDVHLASCPDAPRNYRAIVVAVHGWNGSCSKTFGEGEESIFQVLDRDETHFYDFDCFEYNSTELSIEHNVRALRTRLLELHSMGYTHAMLITHSTGGILALQMITDSILTADNNERHDLADELILSSKGITVPAVQAWATPINGLKSHVQIAGRIIQLVGYSPETLSDLNPASGFLATLKKRLKILGEIELLSDKARPRIQGTSINFYHGQTEDLVVFAIDKTRARMNGWLWPHGRGELIDTGTGHSHNVSDSGYVGTPRFSGKVMELEGLLRLPFEPRYDEIFAKNLSYVSPALERRQMQIVKSLTFYARHRFADIAQPAIAFIHNMVANPSEGARSKKVDQLLVNELLTFFRERTADDEFIGFLIGFGRNVLTYYDPRGPKDVQALGYNEADVLAAMLDLVRFTLNKSRFYVTTQSLEKQSILLSTYDYPSWKYFEKDMHTVLGLFYDVWAETVSADALFFSRQTIAHSTADVLRESPLLDTIHKYYVQNFKNLPQDVRTNIFGAIELAMGKNPELRQDILRKWSTQVTYLGKTRPLWATLDDDKVAERVVDQLRGDGEILTPEEFQFLADISINGGASGKNPGLPIDAQKLILDSITRGRISQERVNEYMQILRDSGEIAVYPFFGKQLNDSVNGLDGKQYIDPMDWTKNKAQSPLDLPDVRPSNPSYENLPQFSR